jgi:hypothetical protein
MTTLDKNDRDELVDFSIRLGQVCWDVYCQSKTGFIQVFLLPTVTVHRRANELFQLGFSARMLLCPSTLDSDTDGEKTWKSYLATMEGKIVLDGAAYPDTPEVILAYAKEFFLEGFRAGSIAVREIFKS